MIKRIIRYKDNQGLASLLINSAVLAYIIYICASFTNPYAKIISLGTLLFLFLLPCAMSDFLSDRPVLTLKFLRFSRFVLYAYIVVLITNVIVIPLIVFLLVISIVIFSMGVAFWFFSHPHIMTDKTLHKVQDRAAAKEEKTLRNEIDEHNKMLNNEKNDSPS